MKPIKQKRVEYFQFWDHCLGTGTGDDPIMCEVAGLPVYQNALSIKVAVWVANGQADNPNNEVITILKSTIVKRKRFKL